MTCFPLSRKNSAVFFLLFLVFYCSSLIANPEDEARIFNRKGVFLAQRGDIEGSLKAFGKAVMADPTDETARSNLATTYNNLGVKLCRQGKYSAALENFEAARAQKPEDIQVRLNLLAALVAIGDSERVDREAQGIINLRPNDSETILKVANAFQKIEDNESARNLLERLLASSPRNPAALLALARLYYQLGNFSEARFYTDRCLEISPEDPGAVSLLAKISREEGIERNFAQERSVHFVLTFEEKIPRDWIIDLLDTFEEAFSKVGDFLGYFPSERTSVIIYSPEDFHKISALPGWAGGLYDGKIRIPIPPEVNSPENLKGTVFHEYTHHLIHFLTDGKCPTWLNEGLAQISEGLVKQDAERILARKDTSQIPSIRKLDGPFFKVKNKWQAKQYYAFSLLAVNWILEEKGAKVIQNILSDLRKRPNIDEVLIANIGLNCESLDSRIRESLE